MSNSPIIFNMTENGLEVEKVTQALLSIIANWLSEENIVTTDVQQQMLQSHLKAMIERAKTGEPLPEIDISLFDEISPESIALAQRVVDTLPGLTIEESYLLSVHFEVARSNP